MTEFSLDPAFVQIDYTSQYSPHKMILPTKAWDFDLGGASGGYVSWDGPAIDAETMITSFVTALKALHPTTTTFENATIFTKASPTAENHPVAAISLGVAGTGVTAVIPAAMQTWSFRTAGFHIFKLVQLDLTVSTDFLPTTFSDLTAGQAAVYAELISLDKAWAGRDNTRPASLIRITAKLSDVLRKAYRFT